MMSLSSMFDFVVSLVIDSLFSASSEKRQKRKLSQEWKKEKEKRLFQRNYRKQKREVIAKYGIPEFDLVLKEQSLADEIIVFGRTRRVMILGKMYSFSDFSSCTYTDNQRILKGEAAFVGKLNNSESPSFSGLEFDSYNTTKFERSSISNKEIITHNYNLIIKLSDSSASVIKIPLGSNMDKVNELLEVINSIISFNSQPDFSQIKEVVSWSS